jgi:hypothetical protein
MSVRVVGRTGVPVPLQTAYSTVAAGIADTGSVPVCVDRVRSDASVEFTVAVVPTVIVSPVSSTVIVIRASAATNAVAMVSRTTSGSVDPPPPVTVIVTVPAVSLYVTVAPVPGSSIAPTMSCTASAKSPRSVDAREGFCPAVRCPDESRVATPDAAPFCVEGTAFAAFVAAVSAVDAAVSMPLSM